MIDGKYRMSVTSIWLLLLMTAVLFQLPEPVVALRGDRVDRPVAGSATGWPEAVAHLRLPQNVACGFPALRSSETDSQHSEGLELPIRKGQLWSL